MDETESLPLQLLNLDIKILDRIDREYRLKKLKEKPSEERVSISWIEFLRVVIIFSGFGFVAGMMTILAILNHIGAINISKLIGF